ncbi:MAG: DivIVA domain-containing protein [Candidatus Zixiibacteriota bacterium]
MKITPVDIKNQQFGKSFRGYDQAEVDAFLETVSSGVADLILENNQLKEKLSSIESTLQGYKNLEGNLKEVLLTAQKSAEEVKKNAEREAQLLMREAKMRSERALEETHHVLSGLRNQIADLKNSRRELTIRLKSVLQTQLQLLESMEAEDQPYKEELKFAQVRTEAKPDLDKKA